MGRGGYAAEKSGEVEVGRDLREDGQRGDDLPALLDLPAHDAEVMETVLGESVNRSRRATHLYRARVHLTVAPLKQEDWSQAASAHPEAGSGSTNRAS